MSPRRRIASALSVVVCVGCGRLGIDPRSLEALYVDGSVTRDGSLDTPDAGDVDASAGDVDANAGDAEALEAGSLDAAGTDAQVIGAAGDADAADATQDASTTDAGTDAASLDAGNGDAAVPDCRLSIGGTNYDYQSGDIVDVSGSLLLELADNARCAAPASCSTGGSSQVVQTSCDIDPCQMWESVDLGASTLALRNSETGMCMHLASTSAGTSPTMWECYTADSMRFQIECAGSDKFYLVNVGSGLRIARSGSAGLTQTGGSSTAQEWRVTANPNAFDVIMTSAPIDANAIWRYRTSTPSGGWTQPSYNDSAWSQGPAAFGNTARGFTTLRTTWNTSDIWLRRVFTLSSIPDTLSAKVYHDEAVQIYINGLSVANLANWNNGYERVDVPAAVMSSLNVGNNTIAVHCSNTAGASFVDVGLVSYTWR